MLNYLTLWIKEEKVRKDLVEHILEQRVLIQWFSTFIVSITLVIQLVIFKQNNDLLTLISNLIYFIGFGVVNSIFLFKFKAGLRWTSSMIMLCQSVLLVYASSPYGAKIASNTTHELIYLQILGAFLICTIVTGQSDFWTTSLI